MRNDLEKSLNTLRNLDLSKFPDEQVLRELKNFGTNPHIEIILRPSNHIFRARLNENNDHYYSKSQLTYKPQQFNFKYQRASTPKRTMFYGSILPFNKQPGDLDLVQATPLLEVIPWIDNPLTKGIQTLTFSRWTVFRDIKLLAILQHNKFYNKSSFTKEVMDTYNTFLNNNPSNYSDSLCCISFLADQFSKKVQQPFDYEYLISALFSELVIESGYDGILYPSVRSDGSSYNVAITPYAADTKTVMDVVVESTVYKFFDKVITDNEYQAILYPNQTHFSLTQISSNSRIGMHNCLKHLGIESVDQLTH